MGKSLRTEAVDRFVATLRRLYTTELKFNENIETIRDTIGDLGTTGTVSERIEWAQGRPPQWRKAFVTMLNSLQNSYGGGAQLTDAIKAVSTDLKNVEFATTVNA